MFNLLKSTSMFQQATKSWRLLFSDTFCCHMKPDTLLSPKRNLSYATFAAANGNDEASDDASSSYGDHDVVEISQNNETTSRPCTLEGVKSNMQEMSTNADSVIVNQPTTPLLLPTLLTPKSPLMSPQKSHIHIHATLLSSDSLNKNLSPSSDCSSSGVSSGILTQPSSMEFSDALAKETEECADVNDEKEQRQETDGTKTTSNLGSTAGTNTATRETNVAEISRDVETTVSEFRFPETYETTTNEELLMVIDKSESSMGILDAVIRHKGVITPLLGVACVHYVYMKALAQHERNSPSYNKLCGQIHTSQIFRDMIYSIETNAKTLNNFALLTVASDLLYLRITLKKSTIPTLLSCIDYESLNLDELRLLASCLHTPSIPLINSEYMYNVAGLVAMRHIDDITDLYTLLSIMKCFGRYFTTQSKRQADARVSHFLSELGGSYPDGRLMASHMFDAFYRMEYAPSRPLQLEACKVINSSSIPLVPQDVSAILRYFVKYGYNLTNDGLTLLNKISDVLYHRLTVEPIAKFTTNVKWLSVFYYYNEPLLERYINAVWRDMDKLDFVALSDVLDTLAQVYYLPQNADGFFERLHNEMMTKYPTLHRSNVKNVQRKLLLTAFHFSVFGRYPWQLINLTLSPEQMQVNHGVSKHFLSEFCESLRIERPDLLPPSIANNRAMSFSPPKLYAFEKDVRGVLNSVVGPRKFTNVSSPVRGLPMFLLRQQLDGSILSIKRNTPAFIPPHMHQTIQNVAVIPLPRSRYCIGSKHAVGKTRHALRLVRAQGARVVTVPHFDWDGHTFEHKAALLSRKIFEQRTDDVIE